MADEQVLNRNDGNFQNAWISMSGASGGASPAPAAKKLNPVQKSLAEIKEYAYEAFDKLDQNGNGYLETAELYSFLEDANTPMREKSFITFLLTNQAAIADACKEGQAEHQGSISRLDLEFYFKLIIQQSA